MELQKALRLRIQQLCDVNELSLRGLSIRCGITYSTLQNVAGGRNRSVTVETVQRKTSPRFFGTGDICMIGVIGSTRRKQPKRRKGESDFRRLPFHQR